MDKVLSKKISTLRSDDIIREGEKENIPLGMVHNAGEALDAHPELTFGQNGLHGIRQNVFSTPEEIPLPPPYAGEHTAKVLNFLDYSLNDQEELRRKKIIQ
jgi:crotonobetainyl-CoA:carnitine CoA-transferase CaiB-like acyl-CoA transferase